MKDVKCSECGKVLFRTNKLSDGAAGSEAVRKGFIFKMPFLYTNTAECLFFCTKECFRSYYDKNIPKNEEVDRKLKEMKAERPSLSRDLGLKLQHLSDKLKQEFGIE